MPELAKYGIVPNRNYRYPHVTRYVTNAMESEMPDSLDVYSYLFDQQASINPRLDSLKQLYHNLYDLPWVDYMHSPQLDSLDALYNTAQRNRNE